MKTLRRFVNVLPPKASEIPIGIKHYCQNKKRIDEMLKKVEEYEKCYKKANGIKDKDCCVFFKNLRKYCVFFDRAGADNYLTSYFEGEPLKNIKKTYNSLIPQDEVILVCCVYNDKNRIKKVYEHHKSIGVNYMVFVDNMSNDGTREFLLDKDVDVYTTKEKYHAGAKAAWIRKIQDIYGYDRWYLIVDSDELFSYVGEESHTIKEVIGYAQDVGVSRVKSMLLDMYSDHNAYENRYDYDDMEKEYCYFDSDTYYEARDCRGEMIRGGARQRVFEYGNEYDNPLTKYPLIYAAKGDIWGDHTPLPFYKNFGSPLLSVLRHYKFMEGDLERYKISANNENYYGKSFEYKAYISKEKFCFYNSDSECYKSSDSLMRLAIMQKIW